MAKQSKTAEEKANVVDTAVAASVAGEDSSDLDSMMKALEEEIAAVNNKKRELTNKVRELKGEPARKTAAPPKPTKTLEQIRNEQDETPKLYAIQRLVIAGEQRERVGQSREEALDEVMSLYRAITEAVLAQRQASNYAGTVNAAIVEYLRANYPRALEFHDRGFASATKGNAKKEATGNDQPADFAEAAEE